MCSCAVHVTSGKFQLVSNFTELHALTQITHPYALLITCMNELRPQQKFNNLAFEMRKK